jgi:Spy/CpxP family protein refolding chaperone
MRKFEATLGLALAFTLVSGLAGMQTVLADNSSKAAKSAPADSQGDSTADSGAAPGAGKKKHGKGGHGHHGPVPNMNQVMGLSDLTDKQKTQLQAIYDAKKPQFVELTKQIKALKADEWQEVQGVLTPAQIGALGGKSAAPAAGGAAAGNDAGGSDADK